MRKKWIGFGVLAILAVHGFPVLAAGGVVFNDDFESGVLDGAVWESWGSPLPTVVMPGRDSAYSMDTQGDASFDSGAQTFQTFSLRGSTLSFDVIVPQTFSNFQDVGVGIASDMLWSDIGGAPGALLPFLWTRVRGDLNNFRVEYDVLLEAFGGTRETFTETIDSAWHRYSIHFAENGQVQFFRDGTLAFTSSQSIDYNAFDAQPIWVGGRSQPTAPVLVDNVTMTSCAGSPQARLQILHVNSASGSQVTACTYIDMTDTGQDLGSYGATLNFDPATMQFVAAHGGAGPFDAPVVNTDDAASGSLSFAQASAMGASGDIHVACVEFDVVGVAPDSATLDLELTSLFTTQTFENLLDEACVSDGTVTIVAECLIGDVNDDVQVNSGDALIVLSNDVMLPIPATSSGKISDGCGDANGDGVTDSIDANLVLSYEVGLPIDPAFPLGAPNVWSDSCATAPQAKALRGAESPGTVWKDVRVATGSNGLVGVQVALRSSVERIGSATAEIRWDPAVYRLEVVEDSPSGPTGTSVMNKQHADHGVLRVALADPRGVIGRLDLVDLKLRRIAKSDPDSPVRATITSLGGVAPAFVDLRPYLRDADQSRTSGRERSRAREQ